MAQGHGFGTEISRTGSISGNGCTQILQTQHGLFPHSKIEVKPTLSELITVFPVQYGGIHGFFSSEGVRGFSAELGSVVLLPVRTPSGSPLENERVFPPFTVHPNCFICMHQGRHLSPWRLHAFHQHASPFLGQELRNNNINGTCSFGIIIKYYS
jgi:hypothetical protein